MKGKKKQQNKKRTQQLLGWRRGKETKEDSISKFKLKMK